jgi:phosphoribosylformylglycinamidine synthase
MALDQEKQLHEVCLEAIEQGLIKSAHDCSEGGLAVTIAESVISAPFSFGAEISLDSSIRKDALLFGESQSRIILSANKMDVNKVMALAGKRNVSANIIGKVTKNNFKININSRPVINLGCNEIREVWKNSLGNYMEKKAN